MTILTDRGSSWPSGLSSGLAVEGSRGRISDRVAPAEVLAKLSLAVFTLHLAAHLPRTEVPYI